MKKIRILKLGGPFGENTPIIEKYDSALGSVTEYRYRQDYGMLANEMWFWNWNVLDAHYKQGDPQLIRVYNKIEELAKKHDVLYHMVGDMMHPEFIKTLSKKSGGPIYTIYNVDGEPSSSKILSHPVVSAYDFALTCSKYYNEHNTCVQMLLANGAYGADWVACGTKYKNEHPAWNFPITDEGKDIDVVFLGANMKYMKGPDPYPPNKYRAIEYLQSKGINVYCDEWKSVDSAAEIYRRAKLGISIHGPSQYGVGNSQRLYDLAVCGVGIVTDGAGFGIDEIFKKDEVMSYLWSNFDEMTAQVKYLLENPEVRILNAKRAREKVRLLYRNDADDNWMVRGLGIAIKYWQQTGLWR